MFVVNYNRLTGLVGRQNDRRQRLVFGDWAPTMNLISAKKQVHRLGLFLNKRVRQQVQFSDLSQSVRTSSKSPKALLCLNDV